MLGTALKHSDRIPRAALQLTVSGKHDQRLSTLFSIAAEYHQYDTIVYPRNVKTKTLAEKAKATFGAVFGWLSGSSQSKQEDVEEDRVLTLSQMCELCLHVYLEPFRNMLSKCDFHPGFNIGDVGRQIGQICSLLQRPKFVYRNSYVAVDRYQQELPQVCH